MHMETLGYWPPPLLKWKVVCIPKDSVGPGKACPTMKLRPISVGPFVYRLWSAIRVRQVGTKLQLLRIFPDQQAGCSLSCHGLLSHGQVSALLHQQTHGVALDFEKAFDRASWKDALWIAAQVGVPRDILQALQSQFTHQLRAFAFQGVMHPHWFGNATGLAQGDPFSPLGLALLLLPVQRKLMS